MSGPVPKSSFTPHPSLLSNPPLEPRCLLSVSSDSLSSGFSDLLLVLTYHRTVDFLFLKQSSSFHTSCPGLTLRSSPLYSWFSIGDLNYESVRNQIKTLWSLQSHLVYLFIALPFISVVDTWRKSPSDPDFSSSLRPFISSLCPTSP